jgi:hypothetical protein
MLEIEKMILSKIKRSRGSHCRQNLNWNQPAGLETWRHLKTVAIILAPLLIDVPEFWRQQVNALTAMGFVAIIRV